MTFAHLLADEGIDTSPVALSYQEGIHRFPSGRQFVYNRHVKIAVHQQRQGSGDRRCGHDQQMGIMTLGGKLAALGNTEAVLLVGDHQTQIMEGGGIAEQRVGTDDQVRFARGNRFPHQPFFLRCQ